MSSLHNLREAVHDHVLRSTILPDAESQKLKQAAAAAKHEAEQEEREAYLDSLVIAPSTPISQNPLVATSRFKPATNRVAQARLKLRLTKLREDEEQNK